MAAGIPPGTAKAGGGDITGVTAGNGISGGGDSGALSIALDLGTNPGLEIDGSAKLQIAKGISQHDVAQFGAGVDDNDYLHVDGTTIEGFSASEVLSDIGGQASLTFGISNTNAVKVDSASVADDEYARFTASGLESRSTSEVLSDIGGAALTGSTDNTVATVTGANALAGETNLTFDGSTLAVTGAVTVSTDLTVSGGDIVYGNGQNATASVTATAHDAAGRNLTITAGATTAGTTNNIAGGALTFQGGQGKGSGAGGSIVFQTANAAGSGSSLNSLATALTLEDDLNATFGNDVLLNTDSAVIKMGADDDVTFTHDGTTGLTVAANPFEVDSGGNITLDAHTGIFIFQDANTEVLRITEGNSGDVTIKLETNAKDLIFTDNGDAEGFRILDDQGGAKVAGSFVNVAGKQDMYIPANAMRPSVATAAADITDVDSGDQDVSVPVIDFDGGSSDECAAFNVAMPKSWNAGTITATFYWTNSNTNAGNVVWGIQGVTAINDSALNTAYGSLAKSAADPNITAATGELMVSAESADCTINNAADGGITFFKVSRDASDTTNDTYASDARLIGVMIHYTTDVANDA